MITPPRRPSAGILSEPLDVDAPVRRGPQYRKVPATAGLEVRHQATGVLGAVVECTDAVVVLRDDSGRDRRYRNDRGAFLLGSEPVELVTPRPGPSTERRFTASGSVAADGLRARVARASRIWVEGKHDAELVEKVWGDDLRAEGIVVEPLHGVDDLAAVVRNFGPRSGRRLGILVDHLVSDGRTMTKEARLAAQVDHPDVCIRGHRFVDIWAAVDPRRVGLRAWPDIPHGIPWKEGICTAVGVDDPRVFWRTILSNVRDFRDLDTTLVGAVEELIDFVLDPS